MIFQFLDSLREKPKAVRDQFALWASVVCIVIVGGVWSMSLPSRLAQTGVAAVGGASTTIPTAPFAGFFDQLKAQFQGIQAATIPTTTVPAAPASTVSSSSLRQTEAALNMQINDENKAAIEASTSRAAAAASDGYGYGTATTPRQTIMIATTSDPTPH
jgi:hypothetical protein